MSAFAVAVPFPGPQGRDWVFTQPNIMPPVPLHFAPMLRNLALAVLLAPFAAFAAAPADPAIAGEWHGDAQFESADAKTSAPLARVAGKLALTISPVLAVAGSSPDTGCELTGTAQPLPGTDLGLDVRLFVAVSNCRDATLDRNYAGKVMLDKKTGATELVLVAFDKDKAKYRIKATLTR